MEMWGRLRALGKWGKRESFVQLPISLAGGAAETPCDVAFILTPPRTLLPPCSPARVPGTLSAASPAAPPPPVPSKPPLKSHSRAAGNPPDLSQSSAGGSSLGAARARARLSRNVPVVPQELEERGPRGAQLLKPTYEKFELHLRGEDALLKNYGLLACFKKDLHKVETYLKVMRCRRYGEGNCAL